MDLESPGGLRLRLIPIAIFVFFLFSVLIVQFYKIQITNGEKWAKVAKTQHQTVIREPFKRGVFYSNTGLKKGHLEEKQPFVMNVLHYHLFADPLSIPEKYREEVAEKIVNILQIDTDILSHLQKKSRSRKIAMWLKSEEKDELEGWWRGFAKKRRIPINALYFAKDFRRSYPFGKMLGQVLHTVQDDKDELTKQAIPTGGLEAVFNRYLVGEEGKRTILRSPRYEIDFAAEKVAAKDGADIYLTINHIIQAIVEEELAIGIAKVKGEAGWAVIMDPYSGEILAMAHYPSFDPGNYREYFNDLEKIDLTRNRAIGDCFEPGSTMKPISIAIALIANEELIAKGEEPLFIPNEMMRCDQNMFPGRSKPLLDTRTHRYLNMYMALQKSSNVYPARLIQKVIERMGVDWYRDKLMRVFGFGLRTGLELPYENPGMVPDPHKTYPNGALQWSKPTPYSLAIGYNLNVNAIQMLRAYAVFANGGFLVKPTILKKIVRGDEVLVDNQERAKRVKRVLSEAITSEISHAMKYAVKTGGSATLADIPGFTAAGKTSTTEKLIKGQYSKTNHFSCFAGFAPATRPRFVLFVGIDEPKKFFIPGFGTTHFGGKCSAPVFREISKRVLEYLGEPPDDPHGFPKGDPRFDPSRADWNHEVKELLEVYKKWNGE